MADPVQRDPASPEPARRPGPQPVHARSYEAPAIDPAHELSSHSEPTETTPTHPPRMRTSSQEMMDELRRRLEELRDRVEKQTSAIGTSLKRELSHDADYVKVRARYYHDRRPVQTLGIVAAAGFVFGMLVGLRRR